MKSPALFLIAAVLWVSSAAGNAVPDQTYCTVVPADRLDGIILCPDAPTPIPESVETITVRDSNNNPYPNASVRFYFNDPSVVLCPHAVLEGATDRNGVIQLTMAGGGCGISSAGCVVRANGVVIRAYDNTKSPDWDGTSGNLRVDGGDYIAFGPAFNQALTPGGCFDFDNSGSVGAGDYAIFARAFNRAAHCSGR